MKQLITIVIAALLAGSLKAQTYLVDRFHRVVVSPYIQATFVMGNEESVTVNSIVVDSSKLHVETRGGTLRVYLEGAKEIPRTPTELQANGGLKKGRMYPNHAVIVTITYKSLNSLSLRGDETFLCESPLIAKRFDLRVYGDSKVIFTEVHIGSMHTTIYGDGLLDIRSGDASRQYYTSFGDGKINTTAINGRKARITAFGEAEFSCNVRDRIKITSFGEAKLRYMGSPEIVKGLHFGGVDVRKLD